jgi:diguanylate cyclase (GGDEF)-like protein
VIALHMRERFSRQAYLLKNALTRDLRLEEEAKRQSEYLSEHDALSGLANRVRFLRRLREMVEQAGDGSTVAVLFLDLDNFKPVNDRYGHAAGDEVLRRVAERVRGTIRLADLAGRLGGDEFVVALPLAEGQAELTVDRISTALRAAISEPIDFNGHTVRVTASVGAASCPEHGCSADELMHAADQSMYRSKRRQGASAELA